MTTSRNGHEAKRLAQHRIGVVGERLQKYEQQWSPISSYTFTSIKNLHFLGEKRETQLVIIRYPPLKVNPQKQMCKFQLE